MGKSAALFSNLIVAGLVALSALKLVFLWTSSGKPDPATGHTEAVIFDAAISHDADYVTVPQMWVLIILGVGVFACFGCWLVATWLARAEAGE
jgi:hypothetical protein